MSSPASLDAALGPAALEVLSAAAEAISANLRQALRGLCLAAVGLGVILCVTAVLAGLQELGQSPSRADLPPGQILYR